MAEAVENVGGSLAERRVDPALWRRIRELFDEKVSGRYEIDRSLCDYFGHNVTWNVDGYLRRVR